MYYKLRSCIIFRDYGDFGYITDNRNFGYKLANEVGKDIGDKIISASGARFLIALGKTPQRIDAIAKNFASALSVWILKPFKEMPQNFICSW